MKFKILTYSLLFIFLISCKSEVKKSNPKYSVYNGTYNSTFNEDGISIGQLVIKYNKDREINFEITTATQSGCTGDLTGTAKIESNGIAYYGNSDCESLTFEFKNNQIIVNEKNCNFHGMRCTFNGTYKK